MLDLLHKPLFKSILNHKIRKIISGVNHHG